MKSKMLNITILLLSAVAGMAGAFVYSHFAARSAEEAAVTEGRPAGGSSMLQRAAGGEEFSLNSYETPRDLPEMPIVDGEGREMTLSAFKGKLVLLNVWATWCVPCREEMPALDRLEARIGGPDFQVVPLSINQGGIKAVEEFYQDLGLENLGIYVDDRMAAPALLEIAGIPGTLLLDREGREIGRKLGPAEWDSDEVIGEIRGYLNEAEVVEMPVRRGGP